MERKMLQFCHLLLTIFILTKPLAVTAQVCSGDVCQCKLAGCEFVSASSTCTSGLDECAAAFNETDPVPNICLRQGVWYSSGGLLCLVDTNIAETAANCEIEQTHLAVNFGGDAMIGSRGIPYAADRDIFRYIAAEKRFYERNTGSTKIVKSAQPEDIPLFKTVVTGVGKKRCDTYQVGPLELDRRYELNLKLKEGCWKQPGARYFTVKFAGLEVFPEIDIAAYANAQYNPSEEENADIKDNVVDLAINFDVVPITETGVVIRYGVLATGFEEVAPLDWDKDFALLEFCASRCQVLDPSFVLAAFSVVKFKVIDPPSPPTPPTPTPNPNTPSPTPPPTPTPPPVVPPPPAEGAGPAPTCTLEFKGLRWPWPGSNYHFQQCHCDELETPPICEWEYIISCSNGQIFNYPKQDCIFPKQPEITATDVPPVAGPGSGPRPPCTKEDYWNLVHWPHEYIAYYYYDCMCKGTVCTWDTHYCSYPTPFDYVKQICSEPTPPGPDRTPCDESIKGDRMPWPNGWKDRYEQCDCFVDDAGVAQCNWVGHLCKFIPHEEFDPVTKQCVAVP